MDGGLGYLRGLCSLDVINLDLICVTTRSQQLSLCLPLLQLQLSLSPGESFQAESDKQQQQRKTWTGWKRCPLVLYHISLLLISNLFLVLHPNLLSIYASSLSCPQHSYPSCHFSSPFSIFALMVSFLPSSSLVSAANRQEHSLYPLCIFTQAALPTIRTHYCQLCHLRSPESQKKGGWGSTVPMKLGSVCICTKWFITFWILPQSTMFNYQ